jgi:hypothetical protein
MFLMQGDARACVIYDLASWLLLSNATAWLLWIQHIDIDYKAVCLQILNGTEGWLPTCISVTNDCGSPNI